MQTTQTIQATNTPSEMVFGQWVKQRRRWLDITQAQLAEQVGCAVITVQKIEAQTLRPSMRMAKRLAVTLQIPAEDQERFLEAALHLNVGNRTKAAHTPTTPTLPSVTGKQDLVGRAETLSTLFQQLAIGQTRLLTLVGPPGVGKTRLAMALAESAHQQQLFVDGVGTVALAEVRDIQQIPSSIAHALALPESPYQSPLDLIKQRLKTRHILLVLDNFEHLLAATNQLRELLDAAPRLYLLLTSRAAVKLAEEQVYEVPPLTLPTAAELKQFNGHWDLSHHSAIALFVRLAQDALPTFNLNEGNANAIAEICIRVDGLPLAIELAAAKCRFFDPAALLQRLEQRLSVLDSRAPTLPARQRRLRDTIAFSDQLLETDEQALFYRLAVFAGGWGADAAEAMLPDYPRAIDLLETLLDNHLIQPTSASARLGSVGETPRFGMLETVREYALERLHAHGNYTEVAQLHARYCLHIARENEMQMLSPRQTEVLDLLEREHDNFRAALRWALQQANDLALELSGRLYFFWQLRNFSREGIDWLQRALALHLPIDTQERKINRARALYGLGSLCYMCSQYDAATKAHLEALQLRRDLGDVRSQATLLNALGQIADQQNELDRAGQLWKDGFALATSINDLPRMTATLSNLGQLANRRGDYTLARQHLAQALTYGRLTGSKYNIAMELHELGNIELKLGNINMAHQLQAEALVLLQDINDKHSIAFILVGLGDIAAIHGELAQAKQHYEDSLTLRREVDHRWGVGVSLTRLASIAKRTGDLGRANAWFNEGITVLRELGDNLMVLEAEQVFNRLDE